MSDDLLDFDIHIEKIGIIIGSALIDIIKRNLSDFNRMEQELVEFVSGIKKVLS